MLQDLAATFNVVGSWIKIREKIETNRNWVANACLKEAHGCEHSKRQEWLWFWARGLSLFSEHCGQCF